MTNAPISTVRQIVQRAQESASRVRDSTLSAASKYRADGRFIRNRKRSMLDLKRKDLYL